jgi:hypothetical protein
LKKPFYPRYYFVLLCCCCSWGEFAQNTAFLTNFTMLSSFSILDHCITLALPGSLARQPCPATLQGSLAEIV